MKRFLILLFCAFGVFTSISQIAYYDAIHLSKLLDSKKHFKNSAQFKDTLYTILTHYLGNGIESPAQFADSANNPFIYKYFDQNQTYAEGFASTFTSKVASSLGNLDVTNFSQGLSMFLIERAKQELNIAFFDKFKKFCEDNPEIGILFPNTSYCLGNLLAYQYTQMLPVLQEAFNKDMEVLPTNVLNLLMSPDYYYLVEEFPEFLVVLNSIILFQQIDNFTPPELIDTLPSITMNPKGEILSQNLYGCLKLTSVFSNAIRTDTNDYCDSLKNYWISGRDFKKNILDDSITMNIFLGLVYQKINAEKISFNGKSLALMITKNRSEIMWYKMQYMNLLTQVNKINTVAKSIEDHVSTGQRLTQEDIYIYLNSAIELFAYGKQLMSHYYPDVNKMDPYIEIAKNANSLYINTVSKNYALAMNNAIFILDAISKQIHNNDTIGKTDFLDSKLIRGMTTYGTFIANVANAESPQEVQAALEAAALPAGSSSFKKNYSNNVALNAYLGVNAGNWPKDKSSSETWNNDFRLTAPIGITWTPFSWGKGGALSIFAQLLDVGAIVNYQLNNDSTEVDQKIYLANIFSPGGYLVYGFGANLPVSLGFGGQYGPGLMKMGEDLWNPSWRWNFFLTVDIPVFNLYKGKGLVNKSNSSKRNR